MKKMTEFRLFADVEKEVAFINKLNKQGWKLEFIHLGAFYKFVKTNEKYFTTVYVTDRSNIQKMISAAVMSGYEVVPCLSIDSSMSKFLYLTGREGEVDEEFVNDNGSKLNHLKNIKNSYLFQFIIVLIPCIMLLLPAVITLRSIIKVLKNIEDLCAEHLSEFIKNTALVWGLGFIGLVMFVIAICIFRIYLRERKRYKSLKKDMALYE